MNTNTTENMNEILGIDGELIEVSEPRSPVVVVPVDDETDINDDHKYARQNLYDIIESGAQALEELKAVARSSQHPRAYEVLQQTLKTLVEANKELLELQKQKKELKGIELGQPKPNGGVHVENAVFVGTTSDLQRIVNEQRNAPKT